MKKLLVTASALVAFAGFGTGVAQAHTLDPSDAEDIVTEIADEEVAVGMLADYEITGSESYGPHKVVVGIETLEIEGSQCTADLTVKFRSSRSNRVSVRKSNVDCY